MSKRKGLIKSIAMLFAICIFFVGCGKKSIESVRFQTAEEAIESFNKYNLENNILEMVKLYSDTYVDSTGYDIQTIEKILKRSRKDAKIVSSEIITVEDYNDTIKKATLKITSKLNNEEKTEDYDYALIKEDDGWSVSPDGIISCINYEIPQYTEKSLNLSLAKNISLFEGGMIRVNVFNDSKTAFMFGAQDNKCEIIIDTSTGQYVTTMDEPTKLDKKVNSYFIARITNLDGEINKVTITNIYDLDKDGNILEDSKKDIIAYSK